MRVDVGHGSARTRLAELEFRDHVERHAHDQPECAEPDDDAVEVVVRSSQRVERPVGEDEGRSPRPRMRATGSRTPEPWVDVATAPPTEMCGSDA